VSAAALDPGESALAGLERSLAALLSCLETPGTEDAAIEHAWRSVQHVFEDVRSALADPGSAPGPRVAELESCLRLYAVASAELTRRRDVLAAQRAACVAARQKLRAAPRDLRGGACDVRG
jgi:hypothetical protein